MIEFCLPVGIVGVCFGVHKMKRKKTHQAKSIFLPTCLFNQQKSQTITIIVLKKLIKAHSQANLSNIEYISLTNSLPLNKER